jgi:hypothetical protein
VACEIGLVGPGRTGKEDSNKHVVVRGIMAGVLNINGLKKAAIIAEYIVTSGLDSSGTPSLPPSEGLVVASALLEVGKEIFEAIGSQSVGHLARPIRGVRGSKVNI